MEIREKQFALANGRRLGVAEGGPPDGYPLFYFHGFPGCRKEAGLVLEGQLPGHVRILAVDRPGMGLSDFQPDRRMLDWPRDIAELADQLGIGQYAVLGLSGGGPYAAACAWAMPDRIAAAAIVEGPTELHDRAHGSQLSRANRIMLNFLRHAPGLAKPSYATFGFFLKHWPYRVLDSNLHLLPRRDQEVLSRPAVRKALASSFQDSVAQGYDGGSQELRILSDPWGFDLQEIRAPVRLWHGELDPIVPVAMGRHLARMIPGCTAEILADESHYSLPVLHGARIIGDLVGRAMAGA